MENTCNICPRNCNAARNTQPGYCKCSETMLVSKVMLHYFEEPPISGVDSLSGKAHGSGAIFFSGCNLGCVYCQNSEISSAPCGKTVTPERLAQIFAELESAGANNINLVTPSHFTKQILRAINIYKPKIPIVWNTSGYEKPETILSLRGKVDIFLTDFKYFDPEVSKRYSFAPDYPENCKKSLLEMRNILPRDEFEDGIMKKGIIVRHLVLPGLTNDSLHIIDWIYKNLGNKTYLSLMSQYVPTYMADRFSEINRKITPLEYKILISRLKKLGFENVFLQDYSSADTVYTPDFLNNDDKFSI